jgi:hypothetical protein|tara:strand:+ start:1037 stop:1450 length:414 start_codon:yes stop_codon:yes gene_type:complete
MLPPFTHDWRPGDRVASIAVRQSVAQTGLGTIQRVLLDRSIILWDDGEQSEERLQDLIIAGFDKSKVIKAADTFGQRGGESWWTGHFNLREDTTSEVAINERLIINQMLISGIPLDIDNVKGLKWGSFINEGFTQGS